MSNKKLISAQKPFRILVANIRGSGDPSRGPSGNPEILRSTFNMQNFVELPGRGPDTVSKNSKTPGTGTRVGLVSYTVSPVPVRASGTITVASNTFVGPTTVLLGQYVLTSGQDFTVAGATQATGTLTVVATPSVADITIGAATLTAAVGARTPGANDYDGTLGTPALIAADIIAAINDAANTFVAIATAASGGGAAVVLTAVPVGAAGNALALATTDVGDVTVSGVTFSGGIDAADNTAVNLAAAIDDLPDYSATALGDVVSVDGLFGPLGNYARFTSGGVSPQNLTFSPAEGTMSGAEPSIGPVDIT